MKRFLILKLARCETENGEVDPRVPSAIFGRAIPETTTLCFDNTYGSFWQTSVVTSLILPLLFLMTLKSARRQQ